MTTKEKEYIYIDKELADKIKQLETAASMNVVIEEYFDKSRKEVAAQVEALDDYTREYGGIMAKARRAFNEAADKAIEKSYEVWEDFDAKTPSMRKKIEGIKKELEPVTKELTAISAAIASIDFYRLEKAYEFLSKISQMDARTADIFHFMIENYERPKEIT